MKTRQDSLASIWPTQPPPSPHSVERAPERGVTPRASAPSGKSKGRRHVFETLDQAVDQNASRIAAIERGLPTIARVLEHCSEERPCHQPICAICARTRRISVYGQLRKIAEAHLGPREIVTIYLGAIQFGALEDGTIKAAHDRLRKRLQRAGFKGAVLVGGTEVAWDATDRSWILHVHLLALGAPEEAWEKLRTAYRKKSRRDDAPAIPIKVQPLNDPERQLSYLTKFVTYHRPPRQKVKGRLPAVSLPPARLVELAQWWSGHRFEDFEFRFGARHRGSQIDPEA